jgi:AcrR family transcriptional regulator
MRTPKLNKADRRKAIVDTAAQLFAEVGFRGGTTRELAKRVGVTEPVLYEHFKTKSELYAAIIDAASREGLEEAREQLERRSASDDPMAFFSHLAGLIVEHQAQNPNYLRLILFSALEKHELSEYFFECHGIVIHRIVSEFIKRQIARGVFRAVDPALAARSFMGMVLHYSLFDQHFGFKLVRASRKRTIDAMVDIFLHGLKSK